MLTLRYSQEQEFGATFIHPSNDPRVITGQGTIATELFDQVLQTQRKHGSVVRQHRSTSILSAVWISGDLCLCGPRTLAEGQNAPSLDAVIVPLGTSLLLLQFCRRSAAIDDFTNN